MPEGVSMFILRLMWKLTKVLVFLWLVFIIGLYICYLLDGGDRKVDLECIQKAKLHEYCMPGYGSRDSCQSHLLKMCK